MSQEHNDEQKGRSFYLLPNLFTVTALFAGFYAVVAAMKGHFDQAAMAIFVAMVMDGLDGRVARLTNTQTPFGAQFDSLSDMVSFGVAPALVVYSWALQGLGKVGWLAVFIYAVAVALRLARFNTQKVLDKRYFQGLASPAAAGLLAAIVWLGNDLGVADSNIVRISVAIVIVLVGLLMVSNIRYRSFKDVDWKGRVPYVVILIIIFALVLIALNPPQTLFWGYLIYALSGPLMACWRLLRRKRQPSHGNHKPSGKSS